MMNNIIFSFLFPFFTDYWSPLTLFFHLQKRQQAQSKNILGEEERYYIAVKYHLKCTVIRAVSFSCGPTWAGHDKGAVCG